MINSDQDIVDIIKGCKKGDRKAQERLYRSFYGVMMNLCLRYTKNETSSMEILNAGFYKVYKNIDRFDSSRATLYTWIRTIIINTCLDYIKSNSARQAWQEIDQAAEIDLPPDVFAKMSSVEILSLVRQLPAATQAVFNLYVMDGFTHKEVAKLLGISEGTSKWHLSEARKILKQLITERRSINE